MPSVYKNPGGLRAVRQWCSQALAEADFPLTSDTLVTSAGRVELTSAGSGRPRVVMVPGTGFNAAVALPWLRALSARWATTVVDLPGQPGLSDPNRPRRARLAWYGRVLNEILVAMDADDVVLVGNSLGAAVVLAADSQRIAARALISPAGFIRLSVDPKRRWRRLFGCCIRQSNIPAACSGCLSLQVRTRPRPKWNGWP